MAFIKSSAGWLLRLTPGHRSRGLFQVHTPPRRGDVTWAFGSCFPTHPSGFQSTSRNYGGLWGRLGTVACGAALQSPQLGQLPRVPEEGTGLRHSGTPAATGNRRSGYREACASTGVTHQGHLTVGLQPRVSAWKKHLPWAPEGQRDSVGQRCVRWEELEEGKSSGNGILGSRVLGGVAGNLSQGCMATEPHPQPSFNFLF